MKVLLCALALLVPSLALAQSTVTVAWDYIGAAPTVVATYTQTFLVDNVAQPGVPTCAAKAGAPADTTCTLTMPMPTNAPHTAIVRAAEGSDVAELVVTNWNPATGPKPGSGVRTTVTVTVVGN